MAHAGHMTVVDADVVETSNLARQVLHTDEKVGMNKAASIAAAVAVYVVLLTQPESPRARYCVPLAADGGKCMRTYGGARFGAGLYG